MKRILVITPFFYPHIGGSQRYVEDLYFNLQKQQPDILVDILCYNTLKVASCEHYRGLMIYRLPCWTVLLDQFYLPKIFPLIKFLWQRRKEYDLLHCSTRFFDTSWWGPIYAKLIDVKVILTDHCADFPVHEKILIRLLARVVDYSLSKIFLGFFDQIQVTNKATQKFLKDNFKVKAKVIYGGVDVEYFKPIKRYENILPVVTYIGRMIDSKGVKELFELAKEIKEAIFYFAGPGPLVESLQKYIALNNVKNIFVIGPVDKGGVLNLLQKSDLFIYPSRHNEGFPNSILEAGSCKLAVLATNTGGVKEVIYNNLNGVLVEPRDVKMLAKTINKLIGDRRLRQSLAKNLYKFIHQKFNWQVISKQFYQEIKVLLP